MKLRTWGLRPLSSGLRHRYVNIMLGRRLYAILHAGTTHPFSLCQMQQSLAQFVSLRYCAWSCVLLCFYVTSSVAVLCFIILHWTVQVVNTINPITQSDIDGHEWKYGGFPYSTQTDGGTLMGSGTWTPNPIVLKFRQARQFCRWLTSCTTHSPVSHSNPGSNVTRTFSLWIKQTKMTKPNWGQFCENLIRQNIRGMSALFCLMSHQDWHLPKLSIF